MSNLIQFDHNKILFILCGCQSEVLVLNYDKEIKLADLAIYENIEAFSMKMSWKQKFRHIWQILIKGTPYNDQIVLDKKQLQTLKEFLIQLN